MIETDSVGTPLPNSVFLELPCDLKELSKALAYNSFLLAAKIAKMENKTFIYNPETKTAQITDKDGFISTISHP